MGGGGVLAGDHGLLWDLVEHCGVGNFCLSQQGIAARVWMRSSIDPAVQAVVSQGSCYDG